MLSTMARRQSKSAPTLPQSEAHSPELMTSLDPPSEGSGGISTAKLQKFPELMVLGESSFGEETNKNSERESVVKECVKEVKPAGGDVESRTTTQEPAMAGKELTSGAGKGNAGARANDQLNDPSTKYAEQMQSRNLDHPEKKKSVSTSSLMLSASALTYSKPAHDCQACGRAFDTQRGLSLHLAHEPEHRISDPLKQVQAPAGAFSSSLVTQHTTSSSSSSSSTGAQVVPTSASAPTTPNFVEASPVHSPTSTPTSPTFNPAKLSGRNYYTRNRRAGNTEGSASGREKPPAEIVGAKRTRATAGLGGAASILLPPPPPPKSMLLNSGEKLPTAEEDGEKSPQKRKSRDTEPQRKEGSTIRPRTRSLSNSDNTSSPVKSSLSPLDMSRSPMTRSTVAAMKTVQFESLPSRRRRRRTRTGGEGKPSPEDPSTSFETGVSVQAEAKPSETEEFVEEKVEQEPPAPPPQPPVKRKRGRPPKIRKDPPSDQSTAAAPPVSSGRGRKRGSWGAGRGGRTSKHKAQSSVVPMEESPLPLKSSSSSRSAAEGPAMKLPLWESFGEQASSSSAVAEDSKPNSGQLQALLSKSKDTCPNSEPPAESDVPVTVVPATLSIPSILPKLYGKEDAVPTSKKASMSSSPSASSAQCSYVTMNLKGATNSADSVEPAHKTKRNRKSSVKEPADDVADSVIIEGKVPVKTEIDLTHDNEPQTEVKKTRKASEVEDSQSRDGSDKTDNSAVDEPVRAKEPSTKKKSKSGKSKDRSAKHSDKSASSVIPASVIVSVLSGPSENNKIMKEKTANHAKPTEDTNLEHQQQQQQQQETEEVGHQRPSLTEPSPTHPIPIASYPPATAPTPTYAPAYPYPGGHYPPQPVMFPPGPSSMYPYYSGYPGAYMSPPGMPGMMPPPPPLPLTTGTEHLHLHSYPPPLSSFNSAQPQPPPPPLPLPPMGATNPTVTSVGGVQVSIFDKTLSQMPTVSIPGQGQMMGRPPHRPPTSMDATTPPALSPVIRPYAAHSPEAMEQLSRQQPHPPHPLSQVYRPGMLPSHHHTLPTAGYPPMPPPHQPHFHHHPHMHLRINPSGMPFMDWGEHKQPQQEEQPSQPVECPECGRMFKNNKALNGHMRLHGGFDWTKKPFTTAAEASKSSSSAAVSASSSTEEVGEGGSVDAGAEQNGSKPTKSRKNSKSGIGKKRTHSRSRSRSTSPYNSSSHKGKRRKSSDDAHSRDERSASSTLPVPRAPNVFTFDTKVDQNRAQGELSLPQQPAQSTGMQDAGTMTQSRSATLHDLCRAAEELERIDNGTGTTKAATANPGGDQSETQSDLEDSGKRRPENIIIPHSHSSPAVERERHRFGNTPPYTPPPILSPARSLTLLSSGGTSVAAPTGVLQPCTPSRIMQSWSSRRSTEHRPSESEESYTEPRINVGKDFQAALPEYNESRSGLASVDPKSTKVWQPLSGVTQEDDNVIDGFLELACSPAVLHAGRNKELATHLLHQVGGSIKEAVRVLLSIKTVFTGSNTLADYNYSGSKRWTGRERQLFRRAWRANRKQFQFLKTTVEGKSMKEVIEYYYSWKKYCSEEYRGRNRHTSEEILTDEDEYYSQVHSSSSSASAENEPLLSQGEPREKPPKSERPRKPDKRTSDKHENYVMEDMSQQPIHFSQPHYPAKMTQYAHLTEGFDSLPIVYGAHTAHPTPAVPVQQYRCKYPGCNQVFTSIFALNGHIRVHGGSFYPRSKMESNLQTAHGNVAPGNLAVGGTAAAAAAAHHHPSTSQPSTSKPHTTHHHPHHPHHPHTSHYYYSKEQRSQQQMELARALLDLPQPRSPARSGGYHTPSPKPSPGKSRSPAKKKLSSASPGEREGYYPCNRCGRVFAKVKSRSAHMKSHIIKQT